MNKGYWIINFIKINDPQKVEAYRNIAGPFLQKSGANFLVRGNPEYVFEKGLSERVVIIEFDNILKAIEIHNSEEYQSALTALGDGADRDFRIIEGI